jgi:hypothetical protein
MYGEYVKWRAENRCEVEFVHAARKRPVDRANDPLLRHMAGCGGGFKAGGAFTKRRG